MLDALPAAPDRFDPAGQDWPETSCYLDLWIELLRLWRLEPAAVLGFAASTAWEGDQFTFARPSWDDLAGLHGIAVGELTLYRPLRDHILAQQEAGATVLVEADAFHLPDTAGTTYQAGHSKTTIAVLRYDPDAGRLDYVHNRGRGTLGGADLDAVLNPPWPPFAEVARRAGPGLHGPALAGAVRDGLGARLRRRSPGPVAAFRDALRRDGPALAEAGTPGFHPYAFATFRMLGTAFQCLGHLASWLRERGDAGLDPVVAACRAGAASAKAEQFRAARAVARRRPPEPGEPLAQAEAAWDAALGGLAGRYA